MSEDVMLQEAIEAIRCGQRNRARDLLTRLLRADQSNPQYWLWMSAVVGTVKERTYCLQSALRLDPGNPTARQGLALAGELLADREVVPAPPRRRKWEADIDEPSPHGLAAVRANPVIRFLILAGVGLAVIGLVLGGIFGLGGRKYQVVVQPTKTAGPAATFTLTPTFIGGSRVAATPTLTGPPPLWALLEATYTPTPVYVSTPHTISEAYRAGQRAYARGDWQAALGFFQQAAQVEPEAADILYSVGEVRFQLGEYEQASAAYDQAISLDPSFAPAYLGRARSRLAFTPGANFSSVEQDFQKAVQSDPNFAEAYLARVPYWLSRGEVELAAEDLKSAEKLLPESPLVFLFKAQLEISQGKYEAALRDAQQAYERDRTLLEAYRTLGIAALVNEKYATSVEHLKTYVLYKKDDPTAWLALGRALAQQDRPARAYLEFSPSVKSEEIQAALKAFDQALELIPESIEAAFYRGLAHLQAGEGQEAINDLVAARRLELDSQEGVRPFWFETNLALGRALLLAGRPQEGRAQVDSISNQAQTGEQRAGVFYWRAMVLDELGESPAALKDWQALSGLPEDAVSKAWMEMASRRIAALVTPTRTSTPTVTVTPTRTTRPSSTSKPSSTATLSPTPKPSVTPKPSATPKITVTPTVSGTPRPQATTPPGFETEGAPLP